MASERIVLDASFILEAIIPTTQAGREDAEAIPDGLANGEIKAVVPWIFYCEIAAGLRALSTRPARQRPDGARIHGATDGTMRTGAQAYDSMYVVLAESMDLPVATVDRGMRTAARSMKVALFTAR